MRQARVCGGIDDGGNSGGLICVWNSKHWQKFANYIDSLPQNLGGGFVCFMIIIIIIFSIICCIQSLALALL
jgi:hypothetical protein